MAEDPFAQIVQDWQDANPTVRPKTKQPTGVTTVISQNPRTAISVAGGAMALDKGYTAWQNVYRDIGRTMKASGKTEAEAVKELTALGFNAKGTMPKVGSKEFVALAREASVNEKLGWIPYFGQKYSNASATTQLPKIQLTGSLPLTTRSPAGIGVLKPAQVTPPLSSKVVLELAKEGRISPEGALSTAKNFPLREALPPADVSKWVKAGRAYKGVMGGDMPLNKISSIKSGFKGQRIPILGAAIELAGAGIDSGGDDGLYANEFNRALGRGSREYKSDAEIALAHTSAGLRVAKRFGRAAGEGITYGLLGMSGLADTGDRRDAIENAHRIFRDEKTKITGDSSKSHPVELTHTGAFHDNHGLTQNTNEKGNELFKAVESSPRFKAIYSKELARLGVPASMWTPDVYKGPEYEYSIDMNDNIRATPFGSALEREQAQIAFDDARLQKYNRGRGVLNVDPSAGPMGWSTIRGTDPRDFSLTPDAENYSTDGYIR